MLSVDTISCLILKLNHSKSSGGKQVTNPQRLPWAADRNAKTSFFDRSTKKKKKKQGLCPCTGQCQACFENTVCKEAIPAPISPSLAPLTSISTALILHCCKSLLPGLLTVAIFIEGSNSKFAFSLLYTPLNWGLKLNMPYHLTALKVSEPDGDWF